MCGACVVIPAAGRGLQEVRVVPVHLFWVREGVCWRCEWSLGVHPCAVVEKGCCGVGACGSSALILARWLRKGAPREVHVVPVRLVFSRKSIVLGVTYFVFIYIE
jgi:hypothetical protein